MPSPVGHALAGAAIAWCARGSSASEGEARTPEARPERDPTAANPGAGALAKQDAPLLITCALLAVAPDLDLLLGIHRTYSHSLGAIIAVFVATLIVTSSVASTRHRALPLALICAAAYGSHVLLDWLGADPTPPIGIQALWPFSHGWYISGLDLFRGTARQHIFGVAALRTNALAVLQEILILGPLATAAWWVRVRRAGRRPIAARADTRELKADC